MMNLYWVMPKDHDLCAQAGDASAKYSGNQASFDLVSQNRTPTGDAGVNARFPQMA